MICPKCGELLAREKRYYTVPKRKKIITTRWYKCKCGEYAVEIATPIDKKGEQ